jgi:hypothetical protein
VPVLGGTLKICVFRSAHTAIKEAGMIAEQTMSISYFEAGSIPGGKS